MTSVPTGLRPGAALYKGIADALEPTVFELDTLRRAAELADPSGRSRRLLELLAAPVASARLDVRLLGHPGNRARIASTFACRSLSARSLAFLRSVSGVGQRLQSRAL
jgi:hypothetical protein